MEEGELDLTRFFYSVLLFGNAPVVKLVVANDRNDAFKTLTSYYSLAKIVTLVSLAELEDLNNKLKGENLIYVLELLIESSDNISLRESILSNKSIEVVQEQYKDKECIILTAEKVKELLSGIREKIVNSSEIPLISKNIEL